MALEYPIPRASSALAGNLAPTPEWYNFFRTLIGAQAGEDYETQIRELADRVAQLEEGQTLDFQILGGLSITVMGTPAGGVVQIGLYNDATNPGAMSRYGTDASGTKGWWPVADAFAAGENVTLEVHPDTGITTISASASGGEILVQDGSSAPPVMLTNEAEDDFLYSD